MVNDMKDIKRNKMVGINWKFCLLSTLIILFIVGSGLVVFWKWKGGITQNTGMTINLYECRQHNNYRDRLDYDLSEKEVEELLKLLKDADRQSYYVEDMYADYSLEIYENGICIETYTLELRVGDPDHFISVFDADTHEWVRSDGLETFLENLINEHK